MRISDWSSDVCSSDLSWDRELSLDPPAIPRPAEQFDMRGRVRVGTLRHLVDDAPRIGRAIDDRGRSLDDFEPLERCEIGFIIERADIQPVDRITRGKAAQLDDSRTAAGIAVEPGPPTGRTQGRDRGG